VEWLELDKEVKSSGLGWNRSFSMRTFSLVVTCVSRIFFFSLNKSLHRWSSFVCFSSSFLFFYFPIFSSDFSLLIPSSYSAPSDKKHVLLSGVQLNGLIFFPFLSLFPQIFFLGSRSYSSYPYH